MTRALLLLCLFSFGASAKVHKAPPAPPAPPAAQAPRPPAPPADADDEADEADDDDDEAPLPPPAHHGWTALPGDDGQVETEQEGNARIYRVRPRVGFHWNARDFFGGDEDDERGTRSTGKSTATLDVKGPVQFQAHALGGELEVVGGADGRISATLTGRDGGGDVRLVQHGDRVEVRVRERDQLRRGHLRVEVPKGTGVELVSMSGDATVQNTAGDVRVRSMSGDVKLSGVRRVDVETVSGDVTLHDVTGPIRLQTVSGKARVSSAADAPQVEFRSASGNLDWAGACGRDCRLSAETISGDVRLALDPKSSFELSFSSHSGELRDQLDLAVKQQRTGRRGLPGASALTATFGKGEGVIEADAFSGSLVVTKR